MVSKQKMGCRARLGLSGTMAERASNLMGLSASVQANSCSHTCRHHTASQTQLRESSGLPTLDGFVCFWPGEFLKSHLRIPHSQSGRPGPIKQASNLMSLSASVQASAATMQTPHSHSDKTESIKGVR